jgi:hypothetical protein
VTKETKRSHKQLLLLCSVLFCSPVLCGDGCAHWFIYSFIHVFIMKCNVYNVCICMKVYVGTAPRKRVSQTRFVSSASEIKRFATIPTHLELPYTPNPPRRIYFFAQQPNVPMGGQTVLTDFREVIHIHSSSSIGVTLHVFY